MNNKKYIVSTNDKTYSINQTALNSLLLETKEKFKCKYGIYAIIKKNIVVITNDVFSNKEELCEQVEIYKNSGFSIYFRAEGINVQAEVLE